MQRAISEGDASGDAAPAGALWTAPAQTRPGQALPLVTPPPSPRAATHARIREPVRPAGLRTGHVGVEGVAVGEMAERREHEVRAVAPHGADDVARLAGNGIGAFHEREVAVRRSTEQRREIGARVI